MTETKKERGVKISESTLDELCRFSVVSETYTSMLAAPSPQGFIGFDFKGIDSPPTYDYRAKMEIADGADAQQSFDHTLFGNCVINYSRHIERMLKTIVLRSEFSRIRKPLPDIRTPYIKTQDTLHSFHHACVTGGYPIKSGFRVEKVHQLLNEVLCLDSNSRRDNELISRFDLIIRHVNKIPVTSSKLLLKLATDRVKQPREVLYAANNKALKFNHRDAKVHSDVYQIESDILKKWIMDISLNHSFAHLAHAMCYLDLWDLFQDPWTSSFSRLIDLSVLSRLEYTNLLLWFYELYTFLQNSETESEMLDTFNRALFHIGVRDEGDQLEMSLAFDYVLQVCMRNTIEPTALNTEFPGFWDLDLLDPGVDNLFFPKERWDLKVCMDDIVSKPSMGLFIYLCIALFVCGFPRIQKGIQLYYNPDTDFGDDEEDPLIIPLKYIQADIAIDIKRFF